MGEDRALAFRWKSRQHRRVSEAIGVNPLRVLVVVKNTPLSFDREIRLRGFFSYPVQEFVWNFAVNGPMDARALKGTYDLVAYEDGSEKEGPISGFPTICFVI